MKSLKKLLTNKRGQSITEYALILGLVVLGLFAAVSLSGLSGALSTLFTSIGTAVSTCCAPAAPPAPPAAP